MISGWTLDRNHLKILFERSVADTVYHTTRYEERLEERDSLQC